MAKSKKRSAKKKAARPKARSKPRAKRSTGPGPDAAEAVPVTGVVLFSCGVGYFERAGNVTGDAELTLNFKSEQINDILKSLVVLDLDGGRASAVTYASQDPTGRALRAFGLDLAGNPSLGSLLIQLRGVRVSIRAIEGPLEGTVLGVESRSATTEKGVAISREVLNLLTGTGMKSVFIDELRDVRILDDNLQDDLVKALAVIASSRDKQRRAVSISFTGKGKRRVRVAYILEAPVWKTSYRLVLGAEKPLLQGWAIVENTTDSDWKDVGLSLVSGRPIAFIMDLYTPLYLPRPVVQPELFAGLRPQAYEEGVEAEEYYDEDEDDAEMLAEEMMSAKSAAPMRRAKKMEAPSAAPMMSAGMGGMAMESMAPQATGSEVGELFSYAVDAPVSIGRQSSAMLPIIAGGVGGDKISIYNQSTHDKHPYNGFRLKNTTDLALLSGPVTIFDDGVYAGDATVPNLQPDEERLISYALDLACTVDVAPSSGPEELISGRIVHGTLITTHKYTSVTEYAVKNKKKSAKTVLIEHPTQPGWEIIEPKDCDEETPNLNRYEIVVKANAARKFTVKAESIESQSVSLTNVDSDFIGFYLKAKVISAEVKAALEAILALQKALNEISRHRATIEGQISELEEEQSRIRSNLDSVPSSSDLYARYLKKLGEKEDDIERLQVQLAELRDAEEMQRKGLNDYLGALEVE